MAGRSSLLLAVALSAVGCGQAAGDDRSTRSRDTAPAPAQRTNVIARVERATGDVRVQAAGSERWAAATQGQELREGYSIQAMPGGAAALLFGDADASTVRVDPGTTLRLASSPLIAATLHPLSGRIVARAGGARGSLPVHVELPPGTLVLAPQEGGTSIVEAAVEIRGGGSSVEMVSGDAELVRRTGGRVAIRSRQWARFDEQGTVTAQGPTDLPVTLLAPLDRARVATHGDVQLSWQPVEGADGYRVHVEHVESTRVFESTETSLTLPFEQGDFRWAVAARHAGGDGPLAPWRTLHVEVDRIPPTITITSPTQGAVIHDGVAQIEGTTEPFATVTLLAAHTRASATGSFSLGTRVQRGLTNLVVRVSDPAGNTSVVSRSVVSE